ETGRDGWGRLGRKRGGPPPGGSLGRRTREGKMKKLGTHVRGHFVAYLALFFALGGTSFAAVNALPKNSVGSPQIKNGSIQKVDISRRTVSSLHGLRGPRGLTGAQGAQGATGAAGATGATGGAGGAGARGRA